jgi:hypothetical protein
MDALEIIKQINNYKKKVENMEYKSGEKSVPEEKSSSNMMSIGTIISIMIGLYAAHLSYECNSKKNLPEMTKIMFSVFAYIFGLFYLIYYYLFQYDNCVTM